MLMITPNESATVIETHKPQRPTTTTHGRLFKVQSAGDGYAVKCETWSKGVRKANQLIAAFSREQDADEIARMLQDHWRRATK